MVFLVFVFIYLIHFFRFSSTVLLLARSRKVCTVENRATTKAILVLLLKSLTQMTVATHYYHHDLPVGLHRWSSSGVVFAVPPVTRRGQA